MAGVFLSDNQCTLCTAAKPSADLGESEPTSTVVAYVDDEIVALLDPGLAGILLAPRSHVTVLSTEPNRSAVFLAALQRVVAMMRTTYGSSGTTIKSTTDLPGASGHVCFHVVPKLRKGAAASSSHDMRAKARLFADALGDQVAPLALQLGARARRPPPVPAPPSRPNIPFRA